MMETKEVYTINEVSSILGISTTSIYAWVKSGRLPGVKVGKFWRIRREEVEKALKNGVK